MEILHVGYVTLTDVDSAIVTLELQHIVCSVNLDGFHRSTMTTIPFGKCLVVITESRFHLIGIDGWFGCRYSRILCKAHAPTAHQHDHQNE